MIAGGGAEKENVIKVFKHNGLENCLGGDGTDVEEVFKICIMGWRIVWVGMLLMQKKSLRFVGSLAWIK